MGNGRSWSVSSWPPNAARRPWPDSLASCAINAKLSGQICAKDQALCLSRAFPFWHLLTGSHQVRVTLDQQLPGVYTNEEQAYFEKDAGRNPPPWIALKHRGERRGLMLVVTRTDAFGKPGGIFALKGFVTVRHRTRQFNSRWIVPAILIARMHRLDLQQHAKQNGFVDQEYQITGEVSADGLKLRFANGTETQSETRTALLNAGLPPRRANPKPMVVRTGCSCGN